MRVLKTEKDIQSLHNDLRDGKRVSKLIRAYKYVNYMGCGPYNNPNGWFIRERVNGDKFYEPGFTYIEEGRVSKNVRNSCGAGINVATLQWCKYDADNGYAADNGRGRNKLLLVEFRPEDIACIPLNQGGWALEKFRLFRMHVVAYADWATGDRLR